MPPVTIQDHSDSIPTLTQRSPSPVVFSPEDVKKILSFESIKELANFYSLVGWTPYMELQILIGIIQNTDDDSIKLRALKDFQHRRAQILENSGLLVKATKVQTGEDGTRTIFSANVVAAALGQDTEPNEPNKSNQIKGVGNEQEIKQPEEETGLSSKESQGVNADSNSTGGGGTETNNPRSLSGGGPTTKLHKPPTGTQAFKGIATRDG